MNRENGYARASMEFKESAILDALPPSESDTPFVVLSQDYVDEINNEIMGETH
jgi:hypothetical protein